MRDQGYIGKGEHEENRARTLETVLEVPKRGTAPYFTEYVRRVLEKQDTALGLSLIHI